MKTIEKLKKNLDKITEDKNMLVVSILFIYMGLIGLGVFYGTYSPDSDEQLQQKSAKEHSATSETTGENFGTVIATAKEQDGHCEYRACNGTICDWYDNSNRECDGINKGEWTATIKNKTYQGVSLCSETVGEFAKTGNPSHKTGAHCWCKSGSDWVQHLDLSSPAYCANNGCAGNCAHALLYNTQFRSALLTKYNTK